MAFLLFPVARAQPANSTTGLVHTADVDLAYEIFGAANPAAIPVIAVNGGPGLSHIYMLQNDVWPRLSHDRQVVFYDQRGTGKSTRIKPNAVQSMGAQVADLEAVRTFLNFPKFALVGDSYGGLLSMAYASAHPDHVAKLILSDSAAPAWKDIVHLLPQVFPDIEEEDQKIANRLGKSGEAAQQSLRNHFRMLFYSEEHRDAYLAGVHDLGYNPQVAEAVRQATRLLDLTAELPKFNFPAMIISGRYDMNVAPLTSWKMYRAIPGAQLVIFAKSGHLPSYEEPDKYVEVVRAFLSGG